MSFTIFVFTAQRYASVVAVVVCLSICVCVCPTISGVKSHIREAPIHKQNVNAIFFEFDLKSMFYSIRYIQLGSSTIVGVIDFTEEFK